jgi:hypothetical protein
MSSRSIFLRERGWLDDYNLFRVILALNAKSNRGISGPVTSAQ